MKSTFAVLFFSLLFPLVFAAGQAQNSSSLPDPLMVQVRKSVAFIKLSCNKGSKAYESRGTGFFVSFQDSRLPNVLFMYLVTNRHVAMCWDARGTPMHVKSVAMSVNLKEPQGGKYLKEITLSDKGNAPWILPEDTSVDLAVLPLLGNTDVSDFKTIPIALFATTDVLSRNQIHEGEPVFFAGFFTQFPGVKRIEPIVRQGIIAMMPDEQIPFVGQPRHLYLADMHVFSGNSGSPAFINLGGIRSNGDLMTAQNYLLLGIVNGEVYEDENFNLTLTATVAGKAYANSGVSTIVPADDLKSLLEGPQLQKIRDAAIRRLTSPPQRLKLTAPGALRR
jgi:hypothetical protein